MKNLAIIPARSGSKGLKNKNVRLLGGKPLLAYSVEAALESGMFSEVMVSTDSSQYAQVARCAGAEVPWLREAALSSDSAGSWEVVQSELERYAKSGFLFDTVCLLQPTSPLRTAEDIKASYLLLEERSAQAVTSVCEVEHPIQFVTSLDESLSLSSLRSNLMEFDSLRRQDMPRSYRLNGAIYIRRISYEGESISLCESPEIAYIMDVAASVDIDGAVDFCVAEALLANSQLSAGVDQDCEGCCD